MELADKWIHPTKFTGNYPDWAGLIWQQYYPTHNSYHPGEDYNFGGGDDDFGQDCVSTANGKVFYTSLSNKGYGDLLIIKHRIGYNLKRFVKEVYGIDTDYLYSLYAHLKDILVKAGDNVSVGQVVAHVGKSGTEWAHLHFEIYSLWKDLKNTSYRFYPVGWSKEKIAENWIPPYKFIESIKNIDSYENFLGKPKEYWLQVEKDRESLLKEIGEKEDEFLKILEPYKKEAEKLQKENKQLNKEIASFNKKIESIEDSNKKAVEKLEGKLVDSDDKIRKLKNDITKLLADQAKQYEPKEAFRIFLQSIYNQLKPKGGEDNGKQ